ncbi:hypothetical protein B0J14DRAFT_678599 [Halenospora varia]|nr:hypothetical protein B0J14DRAFT_678599 [Halenospora varia]
MTTTQVTRPTTIDLWATVAAQISDEDRNNINFSCPDKLNILSGLLQDTKKSRQECIKKRWRYTRKSRETVIFVDLFSKIVKWIDLFKQVGDAAVQYDPVYAALPWAGVRFLLQIAVNDSDKFAFVVESAASIGEIICRYAVFEDVYLHSPSPTTNKFRRALVKFYAAIMVYLLKVKSYFEQNSAMRRLKSGFLAKSDIKSYFSTIATAQETVDHCSCMVEMQDLKRLLECIDGLIERISADLESIKDASKRTEVLRWISPKPYIQHYKQAKREVLLGTGQWLLSDPVFNRSIMIEDAKKAFYNGQSPAPVFFYCSQNTAEPARSSPNAIPGHPLLSLTVAAYKKQEMEGFASGSLGIDESRALILQLVEHYPLTIIVIDALDDLVKIFVSSRRDHDIVLHLQDYPNLELSSKKNKDDISSFVTIKTYNLIKRKKLLALSTNKEKLKTEIIKQVTKNANGMFRWASLQLQSLCSVRTDKAIQERLGRLPPKLEDLYLELYEKLTKTLADTDRKRTLTSGEFLAALSTTPRQHFNRLTKEHILEMCSNMVVFDPTLDTFRFAHLSVREFLENRPEYTRETTNALAAKTLWASRIKERFNDYSIKWDLRRRLEDTEAYNSQSLFIACCFDLQEIVRAQTNSAKYPVNSQGQTALCVAVNHRSYEVISILIDNKLTVIAEEVVKAAAGNWASGREVMMLLLEQRGADVVITEEVVKAAAGNWDSGESSRDMRPRRGLENNRGTF